MRKFTREELKEFNGKSGKPAYIAYRGKVYDVTESFLWKGGRHQALHEAGEDLTEGLKEAPHGEEFILKFPVVGLMESSADLKGR